jgi:Enolase C-terminal domain-like
VDSIGRFMMKGKGVEGMNGKGMKEIEEMKGKGMGEMEGMEGKGIEGMQVLRRSSHVSINGFATIRATKTDTDIATTITTTASTSTSTCASTHFTVSPQRGVRRRPILKLKIGNADGTMCLSDAHRVNELVAQSLSEEEGKGEGEGEGKVEGEGEGEEEGEGGSNGQGKGGDRWLRLDANQSWSVDQAVTFGGTLTPDAVRAIEYVEEPLRVDTHSTAHSTVHRPALYEELCRRCSAWRSIPIALDESLVQLKDDAVRELLDSISNARSREGEEGEEGEEGSIEKQGEDRKEEQGAESRKKQGKEWCVVVKPALVSLDCPFLSLSLPLSPPSSLSPLHEQEQEHAHIHAHSTVTISCTFESGFTLAYLVCIASFFDGSHGVHAKADMAAECRSTQAFIKTIEDDGKGGKVVQVSKAVELIQEYSRSFV